ncbi:MAG: VOC family protein [Eubacteriaceae bacterium]
MNKKSFIPFLTFNGQSEEAMQFYASIFPEAEITQLIRYEKNHPFANADEENKILHGALSFKDQEIMFLDMDAAHPAPEFVWSTSLYIDCSDENEFDLIFEGLAKDGFIMMGPESVGTLRKCAWVTDKFGVTWQPVWE